MSRANHERVAGHDDLILPIMMGVVLAVQVKRQPKIVKFFSKDFVNHAPLAGCRRE